jgi:hypothetical protein
MGIEDGETCCVVCYAAPWMPIVEQECGSEAREDHSERNAAIVAAYEAGAMVKDLAAAHMLCRDTIARIIGTQVGLSDKAVERRNRGRGPAITMDQLNAAMELQAQGHTWRQIGLSLNRKPSAIKDAVGEFRAGRGKLALAVAQQRQASGEPLEAIAASMGVAYESLTQRLRRAGGNGCMGAK